MIKALFQRLKALPGFPPRGGPEDRLLRSLVRRACHGQSAFRLEPADRRLGLFAEISGGFSVVDLQHPQGHQRLLNPADIPRVFSPPAGPPIFRPCAGRGHAFGPVCRRFVGCQSQQSVQRDQLIPPGNRVRHEFLQFPRVAVHGVEQINRSGAQFPPDLIHPHVRAAAAPLRDPPEPQLRQVAVGPQVRKSVPAHQPEKMLPVVHAQHAVYFLPLFPDFPGHLHFRLPEDPRVGHRMVFNLVSLLQHAFPDRLRHAGRGQRPADGEQRQPRAVPAENPHNAPQVFRPVAVVHRHRDLPLLRPCPEVHRQIPFLFPPVHPVRFLLIIH